MLFYISFLPLVWENFFSYELGQSCKISTVRFSTKRHLLLFLISVLKFSTHLQFNVITTPSDCWVFFFYKITGLHNRTFLKRIAICRCMSTSLSQGDQSYLIRADDKYLRIVSDFCCTSCSRSIFFSIMCQHLSWEVFVSGVTMQSTQVNLRYLELHF